MLGGDYFGASLQSFVNLMKSFDYMLICCSAYTGANAFFVPSSMREKFQDCSSDLLDKYIPPNYHLPGFAGHRPSVRTIEHLFKAREDMPRGNIE